MNVFRGNGRRDRGERDRRPSHVRTAATRAAKMTTQDLAGWVNTTAVGLATYATDQAAGAVKWPQVHDAEVLLELVRELERRATGR